MITIKKYIKDNKHLLFTFVGLLFTLIIYSTFAFCFATAGFAYVLNSLSTLSTEFWAGKAIDGLYHFGPATFNLFVTHFPTINFLTGITVWSGVAGLGALYTADVYYNRYYILNKYAESIKFVGSALDGLRWLFPNLKFNGEYVPIARPVLERIVPKGWLFPQEVEKIIEREVEVLRYRDRPQLQYLHKKLDKIERSIVFINDNSDFHNKILREMHDISFLSNQSIGEDCTFIVKGQELPVFLSDILKLELKDVGITRPLGFTPGSAIRVARNPSTLLTYLYGGSSALTKRETKLFGVYSEHQSVELNIDFFKSKYPKIYLLLKTKQESLANKSVTLNIGYEKVGRGVLSGSRIAPDSFTLEYSENGELQRVALDTEIEAFYDTSMNAEKLLLQQLTDEVRGFIYTNSNSEIDDYLEKRLETETLINKTKDLIGVEEYLRRKREMVSSYRETIQPPTILEASTGALEEKENETESLQTTGTQTDIITPLSIGSVGLVATLTQLPLDQAFLVLNHILGLAEFQPLLNNAESVYALAQLYENNGMDVPELLQNYVNTHRINVQESYSFIGTAIDSYDLYKPYIYPAISFIGLGVLTLGSAYLIWRYTGDSSAFVQQKEIMENTVSSVLDKMID